jgi:hypothetical protein
MIRLTQEPMYPSGSTLSVEIEVLPPANPEQRWVDLLIKGFVNEELVVEMDSSTAPEWTGLPLKWLEKKLTTRKHLEMMAFSDSSATSYQLILFQYRLSEADFLEIQQEIGEQAFPYPFIYDLTVLSNPDPEALNTAGFGIHLGGFSHPKLYQFLSELHDEVKAVSPWFNGA